MEARRLDFPALDQDVNGNRLVYLDNAATTQKPRAVIGEIRRFYERDNSNVHRGVHELSNRATLGYEGARKRAAEFLNATSAEEIIFTRGTTESINLVASAWGARHLRRGDRILLTEMEHHSNLIPWQLLAARAGARLDFVPVTGDEGLLDLGRIDELLDGTRLFAFTHISNALGTVNPVGELCRRAKAAGAVTLVDAAQSAGHAPLNVREIGCDFLALSAHKMAGPTGMGLLYGRRELLEAMDPYQGGGEMISSVDFGGSTWAAVPHKFEAGTPDISGAFGLRAAMDYLDGIGRDRILEHDRALGAYAYARLAEIPGIRLLGPAEGRAGLVSFVLGDVHAHDVVMLADRVGIALRGGHHCTQPLHRKLGVESTTRASFYLYNTAEEIDRLADVLREIKRYFSR
ncbi:MAG TPA: cysteine desulfurase [Verrucomicrobiae bacterium]|nr:cysteine desulfurase [Verrucomicrobiae bacterium]